MNSHAQVQESPAQLINLVHSHKDYHKLTQRRDDIRQFCPMSQDSTWFSKPCSAGSALRSENTSSCRSVMMLASAAACPGCHTYVHIDVCTHM